MFEWSANTLNSGFCWDVWCVFFLMLLLLFPHFISFWFWRISVKQTRSSPPASVSTVHCFFFFWSLFFLVAIFRRPPPALPPPRFHTHLLTPTVYLADADLFFCNLYNKKVYLNSKALLTAFHPLCVPSPPCSSEFVLLLPKGIQGAFDKSWSLACLPAFFFFFFWGMVESCFL